MIVVAASFPRVSSCRYRAGDDGRWPGLVCRFAVRTGRRGERLFSRGQTDWDKSKAESLRLIGHESMVSRQWAIAYPATGGINLRLILDRSQSERFFQTGLLAASPLRCVSLRCRRSLAFPSSRCRGTGSQSVLRNHPGATRRGSS